MYMTARICTRPFKCSARNEFGDTKNRTHTSEIRESTHLHSATREQMAIDNKRQTIPAAPRIQWSRDHHATTTRRTRTARIVCIIIVWYLLCGSRTSPDILSLAIHGKLSMHKCKTAGGRLFSFVSPTQTKRYRRLLWMACSQGVVGSVRALDGRELVVALFSHKCTIEMPSHLPYHSWCRLSSFKKYSVC